MSALIREPGAVVREDELQEEYQRGFAQAVEVQRVPAFTWTGTFPLPDARGEVHALHVRVSSTLTFIPEDPRTRTAAAAAVAWTMLILAGISLLSAWGFSASVADFPRPAFLSLLVVGLLMVVISVALFWYDHVATRRRMREVATHGVYVFPDAVLSRTKQGVRIFPRPTIVAVETESQSVMGGAGPASTRAVYNCRLRYRGADGTEKSQKLGLAFPGDPHPIVPVLKRALEL